MKNLSGPVNPDEFGRSGMDVKAVRLATEKSEISKAFMRNAIGAGIGVVALAVAGVAGVYGYTVWDNHANDPVTMENWKISEQVKLQVAHEKLTAEQKKAADEAMAKAQEEAAALAKQKAVQDDIAAQNAVRAARPNKLLEEMFKQTSISEAVCSPSNIELTATFKANDTITDFEVSMPVSRDGNKWGKDGSEAYAACEKTFTMEKFAAPRGLELLPSGAHYNQLKDMWNLCRGGFTEEELDYDVNSDGSADLYYQLYAKNYYMDSAQEYKGYTECMAKALDHPLIKTGPSPMAAVQ